MVGVLPRISIITPNFNQGAFLESTIRSVLDQDYPNLEYIIIDGASTDRSLEIILKYADRLAYWVSEKDGGHYDAINKGLNRATGDVMAWINSDDIYFPHALLTVGQIFQSFPQVSWLTSATQGGIDYAGNITEPSRMLGFSKAEFLDGRLTPKGLNSYGCIQQESTFWRRELWQKAGAELRLNYSYAGDFDLWARFFEHAELYYVRNMLAGFRTREGQRSADINTYLKQAVESLEELRQRNHWSKPTLRRLVEIARQMEIPLLRGYAVRHFGYSGLEIRRQNGANADANWTIRTQKYL